MSRAAVVAEVRYAFVGEIAPNLRARLLATLSDEERARHAKFHAQVDRDDYLAAHALLRAELARHVGVGAAELRFETRDGGKPLLAAPRTTPPFTFSLSHARGLVACVIARGADVGLDVEDLTRHTRSERLEARVLSAHERTSLDGMDAAARRRRFFETWTLKEAYAKATGAGMSHTLGVVEFAFAPHGVASLRVPHPGDDPRAWSFHRHEVAPCHLLAVAVRASAVEVALAEVALGELAATITPS